MELNWTEPENGGLPILRWESFHKAHLWAFNRHEMHVSSQERQKDLYMSSLDL